MIYILKKTTMKQTRVRYLDLLLLQHTTAIEFLLKARVRLIGVAEMLWTERSTGFRWFGGA